VEINELEVEVESFVFLRSEIKSNEFGRRIYAETSAYAREERVRVQKARLEKGEPSIY
tara:strand:+ start:1341 stop:1514 length:174 start_codon:yes stop_codon:yes gene_type:complete